MKYFQRLLRELQTTVASTQLGETLVPPSLLGKMDIDGNRLCYFQMGMFDSGPTVIFIHGFGGNFMDWPRVMLPLSHHLRTFALDLPGWGFSEAKTGDIGIEYHVDVLIKFIQQLKLQNIILVGFSYGAAVAYASAVSRRSDLFKHILLINPMPPFPIKYMTSLLYKGIFNFNRLKLMAQVGHKFVEKYQFRIILKENLYFKKSMDTFYLELGYYLLKQPKIALTLHMFAKKANQIDWQEWENSLKKIEIPTTIMKGLNDKIFSLESAHYLLNLIPTSELITIRECGHAMAFDQHRKITAKILQIVESEFEIDTRKN